MCKNCVNWPQKLPLILLVLRSAFKPDIQTTSAQLVYGTTLRLPGEFFHQKSHFQPQTDFAKELEEIMRNHGPSRRHITTPPSHLFLKS